MRIAWLALFLAGDFLVVFGNLVDDRWAGAAMTAVGAGYLFFAGKLHERYPKEKR